MKEETPSYERYQRQILLKGFGLEGQLKLLQAKVLVIGAGGLGCPALQYLAAAGVGTIGIVDEDIVSITNLHRQILFTVDEIGLPKASTAKERLAKLNPEISINAYNERLTTNNALAIIKDYDIVIDATDNFSSRYLINDACVLLNKPIVYGAVSQFEGQVAILNYHSNAVMASANYRDLFPTPPIDGEVLNCAEAGVLGVLPGIIGSMQASETIKLITGIGKPLVNTVLTYHSLTNQMYEIEIVANPSTRFLLPVNEADFIKMDYEWFCTSPNNKFEIDIENFNQITKSADVEIIDVRELGESPIPTDINYAQIPLSQLNKNLAAIKKETIVVFCQSGKRSLQAAQILFDTFGERKIIYSLKGGITEWVKNKSTEKR
ncbi:MAG: molybdopterin-synthase adenylyltransferase MoeB [Chitinophagia bacterium]|nr:molybdopterin-synthase adenylyltransferase MoeB [Chitinophagia bacterium]